MSVLKIQELSRGTMNVSQYASSVGVTAFLLCMAAGVGMAALLNHPARL